MSAEGTYDKYIIIKKDRVAIINLYDTSEKKVCEGIAQGMKKGDALFINAQAKAQRGYESFGIPFVSGEFKHPISESQLLKILKEAKE